MRIYLISDVWVHPVSRRRQFSSIDMVVAGYKMIHKTDTMILFTLVSTVRPYFFGHYFSDKLLLRKKAYFSDHGNGFRITRNVDLELNMHDPMALHMHCHFLSPRFWENLEATKAVDGDFYFRSHTFERMGSDTRWHDLDMMIGKLTDDLTTDWIDVKDLFTVS